MQRRTISPVRYVLGLTIMLVALGAFLVLFTWAWLDVSGQEFLAILTREAAVYTGQVETTTWLLAGALVLAVFLAWRLFGFGSMEP